MATFVLVHSPLVGPATWMPVGDALGDLGMTALVPDLGDGEGDGPFWRQHALAAARAIQSLPDGVAPVLAGHSGAGALLPAIREAAGREVAGYVFVDAGLPEAGPRMGSGEFARQLRDLYAGGGRYPNWTDEMLSELLPDPVTRRVVLDDLRPQPFEFWEESLPVFPGWPDAPCAYLRFVPNPAYDDAAAEARRRGWPYAEMAGHHFQALADPRGVAAALVGLLGVTSDQ